MRGYEPEVPSGPSAYPPPGNQGAGPFFMGRDCGLPFCLEKGGGVEKMSRQPTRPAVEDLPVEVLLQIVERTIERRFGREKVQELLQHIRTRCEECPRTFVDFCRYCGARLCEQHSVDCQGVTYCRSCADPEVRMADVVFIKRW
jgi:hypothetical protein